MRITPQRLTLSLLPTLALIALTCTIVWGQNGLLVLHKLTLQVRSAQEDLAAQDRANELLLHEIQNIERDPITTERMIADELNWGRPGDLIVRFD